MDAPERLIRGSSLFQASCLRGLALLSLLITSEAQTEESRVPRSDCGDTTFVVHTPTPQQPLNPYPITSRCSDSRRSFGDHLLVVAGSYEDTCWMTKHISIPFLVYHQSDMEDVAHTFQPGANEAGGYLRFIAEYYDCLPEVILFAHPHRKSNWHSSESLDYNVNHVNWDKVPGFALLHRQGLWWEAAVKDPTQNLPDHQEVPSATVECQHIVNGTAYNKYMVERFWLGNWMLMAWPKLFEPEGFGGVPEKLKVSKSSEFFVTRGRIQARPRDFYLKCLQYIHEEALRRQSNVTGAWPAHTMGLIFEHTWHHIFGEDMFLDGLTVPECELYRCNAKQEAKAANQ
ncbi:hypothetical protein WJX73_001397 [Symbiochloris irregularis]|uniref:Uncharacterized protein n=1 Tax=Symbiochloris irregularis TaxID=706552 RepID=A0AAW1PTY3_9CHLO